MPVEYYSGTDGGESWSEGSRNAHVYLSAPPAGPYVLRTEIQRERPHEPMPVDVRVRQGVPHPLPWVLAMLALAVVPACVAVYHIVFEHARWKDSAYSPYHKK